jgi:hypothetical protein
LQSLPRYLPLAAEDVASFANERPVMFAEQLAWTPTSSWKRGGVPVGDIQLVLYFGAAAALKDGARYGELRAMFPRADIVGCSTAGQISRTDVRDDAVVAIAMSFADTPLATVRIEVDDEAASRRHGAELASALRRDGLSAILIIADGLRVNGSELIAGVSDVVGPSVCVVGGLAGDDRHFETTVVGVNDEPRAGCIGAVGFYGQALRLATGSAGGWDPFGPRRMITRSTGSTLYELDGEPALDLYERYLGDEAAYLPDSGLYFPLKIHDPERPDHDIVRTVKAVDRDARSLTFAGDIPEGWIARLMRGTHERLVEGAREAGRQARAGFDEAGSAPRPPRRAYDKGSTQHRAVALLVSCVNRRAVMCQRAVDEVEAALAAIDPEIEAVGFYSYGEIAPHATSGRSEFHNQMMTVALMAEHV